MKISVQSGFGTETATKIELRKLLGKDVPCDNGHFIFEGSTMDIAKCNLWLRTADRVQVILSEFEAKTFDELFDNIFAYDWQELLEKNARIIVNAHSVHSSLYALSAIQSISKKAIVEKMFKHYTYLPENGNEYKIDISIFNDKVTVYLDTSGDGLHKRGYRTLVWNAPIKETLASSIIELSVWNPERAFADVFCGSGTFPIEATMKAINMAPGLKRSFAFENYSFVDKDILPKLKQEAEDSIDYDKELRITGFDIEKKAIGLSVKHAKNFGLDKYIHFETADMRTFHSRFKYGVIISNPPYGERLCEKNELKELYKDLGKMYRSLDDWSLYAITSYADFERYFGAKSAKTRRIFNAKLECRLYSYLGNKPKEKI